MCVLPEEIEDRERRQLVTALSILADDCHDSGRAGQETAGLWEPYVRMVRVNVMEGTFFIPLARLTMRDQAQNKDSFHRQRQLSQVLSFGRDFYKAQPWYFRQRRELVEMVIQRVNDRIS